MNEPISGQSFYYIDLYNESTSSLPAGYEKLFSEHFHTEFEMLLVLKGMGNYTVMGKRYSINPYDLFIVPPGKHHFVQISGATPYERVLINFRHDLICSPQMQRRLWSLPTVINIEGSRIMDEYKRIGELIKAVKPEYRSTLLQGQLEIILSLLASGEYEGKTATYFNPELDEILSFIDNNISDISSSKDVYSQFPKSASSIQKLFSKEMHISLMSYIRTRKCHMAKELIDQGTPAKVVYKQCGFSTYSTFYRDYVNVYGNPPTGEKVFRGVKASLVSNDGKITAFNGN